MSTYTDKILQWAADTRRAGPLDHADGIGEVGLGEGEAGTRLAVRFALRLRDGRIETVRYQVFGCGFTIAACAAAAQLAEGHTSMEVAAITPAWVDAALGGLPAERGYCAALAVEALQAALKSAQNGHHPVTTRLAADDEQAPRVTAADPVYRLLVDSPAPPGAPAEDRHLFACLLAVAVAEPCDPAAALGLSREELADLVQLYFPAATLSDLEALSTPVTAPPPRIDTDLHNLLGTYLPHDADGWTPTPSLWLIRIFAARTSHPGHLWHAMGLFARPELTAAIRRHLPALAAANRGMRWKRFLFRQLCDQRGGIMCKMPDCGECSDHAFCFGEG